VRVISTGVGALVGILQILIVAIVVVISFILILAVLIFRLPEMIWRGSRAQNDVQGVDE
jgi:hypothetical protein